MKNMLKTFIKTLKEYVNYLMKVDFKELFANTVILVCILILAAFVYIPVGIVQDLIRNLLTIFVNLNGIIGLIYTWTFSVIGAIVAILAFIYLFNKRYESIQKSDEDTKENNNKLNNKTSKDKEDLELPKVKK